MDSMKTGSEQAQQSIGSHGNSWMRSHVEGGVTAVGMNGTGEASGVLKFQVEGSCSNQGKTTTNASENSGPLPPKSTFFPPLYLIS